MNSEHAQNALWIFADAYCVPDMIEVELTYVPIKGGIVYPDVDRFFYSLL